MTEDNQPEVDLIPHALKSGLLMGLINICLLILIYMTDISIMVDWVFSIVSFLLFAAIVVVFGRRYRDGIGGFLSYGRAFQYGLIMLSVSALMGVLFNIVLFNFIDPELPETMTRLILESQEKMLTGFGASDEIIDQTLDDLEQDLPAQYSIQGQLASSWVVLLGACLVSLITALFIKKKKPDFAP